MLPAMSRKAKFDDIQIKNGALEQEGKKIAAHLQKVREYEAAAREKAGHELKKADEHFVSLTQELAAVKAKCKSAGFKVFKEKYCPDLSRSRIYQLLEIGTGKKTLEQSRAEKRDSVSKSRAAKKSTTSTSVVDKPAVGLGNGEACENKKAELKGAPRAWCLRNREKSIHNQSQRRGRRRFAGGQRREAQSGVCQPG